MMADNNRKPNQGQQPQRPRIYRGRPENQADPKAVNQLQQLQQQRRPPKLPKALPSPTQRKDYGDLQRPKLVEKSPMSESIFVKNITIREVDLQTTQRPSFAASVDIARRTYIRLLNDDSNLAKSWTNEAFEYYVTAMLWLRIVNLKSENGQRLTPLEGRLKTITSNLSFNLPEPIKVYLMCIGNTITRTGQHLYPDYPTLPETVIDGIPATYGLITSDNHNDCEEFPTLGVHIGMIKATLSNEVPIPQWRPPIVPQHVNAVDFPDYPTNSGFNLTLLQSISRIIATNKTYKITSVRFSTVTAGSTAQLITKHPVKDDNPRIRNINSTLRAKSLLLDTTGSFGMAIVFCYQLFKGNVKDSTDPWCCISGTPVNPVPDEYYDNRNNNRTLPYVNI